MEKQKVRPKLVCSLRNFEVEELAPYAIERYRVLLRAQNQDEVAVYQALNDVSYYIGYQIGQGDVYSTGMHKLQLFASSDRVLDFPGADDLVFADGEWRPQ